ncbi:hypothetical protein H5410_064392 [Solanum commersonii]|uniref:Uncharacterized protein n=1 Tax=Solanum commersonii TaxID=4109 RepID=A0A9J5VZG8_SOLCO|nr:hypothetical protein H5410_064392 [Solanum commersonii]
MGSLTQLANLVREFTALKHICDEEAKKELLELTQTLGKGYEGVVTRWAVTGLPRKTHRGLSKCTCINAWQPARVSFAVVCACQSGNILEMDFEPFTTITPPKSLSHSIGNGLEFLMKNVGY